MPITTIMSRWILRRPFSIQEFAVLSAFSRLVPSSHTRCKICQTTCPVGLTHQNQIIKQDHLRPCQRITRNSPRKFDSIILFLFIPVLTSETSFTLKFSFFPLLYKRKYFFHSIPLKIILWNKQCYYLKSKMKTKKVEKWTGKVENN